MKFMGQAIVIVKKMMGPGVKKKGKLFDRISKANTQLVWKKVWLSRKGKDARQISVDHRGI